MKSRTTWWALAILATSVLVATQVLSQDDQGKGGEPQMSAEEQAKWAGYMKLAEPGENHKLLEHYVGNWTTSVKMWMGGPGAPASETTGRAVVKSIMGGRYFTENYTGEFMGMPFEGFGLYGYDNYKNMFTTVWVDSMGTAIFTALGQADPSGKVFTYYGKMDDPMENAQDRTVKSVIRIINNDKHVFEWYELKPEGDRMVMELTYDRVK